MIVMRLIEFDAIPGIGQESVLNPKIWHRGSVRPEVQSRLLKTAKLFKSFIDIDFPLLDVQIVGAQAGTTYTEYSDLDLHLITDFSSISCDQELSELFDTKRLLFKNQHKISIRGIPVEPGVEDRAKPTRGNAYSLIKNRWIRRATAHRVDLASSESLADIMARLIVAAIQTGNRSHAEQVLKLLRTVRKLALSSSQAEYHPGNIAYKSLRNQGLIDDLTQWIKQQQDRELSLNHFDCVNMTRTIYLDMDGVLADFNGFAAKALGTEITLDDNSRLSQEQWERLAQIDNLYLELSCMPHAEKLVDVARRFRDELGWDLYILTAVPRNNDVPNSFYDKVIWAQRHFPDIVVRFGPYSQDKQNHCTRGDLLVDDRESNLLEWRARGGIAIAVKQHEYSRAINSLKNLLEQELNKDS